MKRGTHTQRKKETARRKRQAVRLANSIMDMMGQIYESHGGTPLKPRPASDSPKSASVVTTERIITAKRFAGFNPLRGLSPEVLVQRLDGFRYGFLRDMALTWDLMERRDPQIKTDAGKRKKAPARHGFEIIRDDDSPEAMKHEAGLNYFYSNLRCEDAFDQNRGGKFPMLVEGMMDAQCKYFAVHEIVYVPKPGGLELPGGVKGDGLTATLRSVPLWFFENLTGRLRYLLQIGDAYGAEMPEGEWLVTCGDGLMEAAGIAYMLKTLPLMSWVELADKYGHPLPVAETDAAVDSPEWNALKQILMDISHDFAAVIRKGSTLTFPEIKAATADIHDKLIDKMDRYITVLFRGSDLKTTSRVGTDGGNAVGSNPQESESDIFEDADCELITGALRTQVDPWVIRYLFGEEPKAHICVRRPEHQNTDQDLKIDEFAIGHGFPTTAHDFSERYNRPLPADNPEAGKILLSAAAGGVATGGPDRTDDDPQSSTDDSGREDKNLDLENAAADPVSEKLIAAGEMQAAREWIVLRDGIRRRLEKVLSSGDPVDGLKQLQADLPAIFRHGLHDPAFEKFQDTLGDTMSAAIFNGMGEVAARRTTAGRGMVEASNAFNLNQPRNANGQWTIDDVVKAGTAPKHQHIWSDYAPVSAAAAARIQTATGLDVKGYTRVLTSDEVRKNIKKHSNDPRPITSDDFRQLPTWLENATSHKAGVTHLKLDAVITRVHDTKGHVVIVEERRTGRKKLALKSIYRP